MTTSTTQIQGVAPRLAVRDVVLAAEWYRDTLGFAIGSYHFDRVHTHGEDGEEVYEHDPHGKVKEEPAFVHVHRDGCRVQLISDHDGGAGDPTGVYFWLSGVDALFEQCRSLGAEFIYEVASMPYGMREFALRDPDGNFVGFGEDLAA